MSRVASVVFLVAWIAVAQPSGVAPTGTSTVASRRTPAPPCPTFVRPDADGHFISSADVRPPSGFVDGNDLLAIVNRAPRFSLDPRYDPTDLVDVRTMQPMGARRCVPPHHQCLRREAAEAFRRMSAAMRAAGHTEWIDSAFRSYLVQCSVFRMSAYLEHRGFCVAASLSALPGHSQHQLGTAIDVFTRDWVSRGARFREGFGCSAGGRWLAQESWRFGFVLPYPLHPDFREAGSDCAARPGLAAAADPRTGYRYEPWHLRFIGVAEAEAFHAAWQASGPGAFGEITLEQWLRSRRGLRDVVEPPVCDGCNCVDCATFAVGSAAPRSPCGSRALELDAQGMPLAVTRPASLGVVRLEREGDGTPMLRVRVDVPEHTITQTPVVTPVSSIRVVDVRIPRAFALASAATSAATPPSAATPSSAVREFAPVDGSLRLGVARMSDAGWPWQIALARPERGGHWNGINARIPASVGSYEIAVPVVGIAPGSVLRVALVSIGHAAIDERTVTLR